MKNHLIKNIHIKDFKCFDDFKAKGFARVNLIGGKNNVGKTAFLEACHINVFSLSVKTFSTVLILTRYRRRHLDNSEDANKKGSKYILENTNALSIMSNQNNIQFYMSDEDGVKEYLFKINEKKVFVNSNDFSFEITVAGNTSFINSIGYYNSALIRQYSFLQKNDKEEYLNGILRELDPSIESFKVIGETPQCKVNSTYIELTEMGDGVRHLVSIVASFYGSIDGYLFIDEIGNGIHYTMFDNIWRLILKLSKDLNVQVFATTHSKECIESFNRVQLKLKYKESSYFELAKEKETSKIFMRGLDSEQLEYELSHQGRYRGE